MVELEGSERRGAISFFEKTAKAGSDERIAQSQCLSSASERLHWSGSFIDDNNAPSYLFSFKKGFPEIEAVFFLFISIRMCCVCERIIISAQRQSFISIDRIWSSLSSFRNGLDQK